MRIKEQETHLTLQEHDDDDDVGILNGDVPNLYLDVFLSFVSRK